MAGLADLLFVLLVFGAGVLCGATGMIVRETATARLGDLERTAGLDQHLPPEMPEEIYPKWMRRQ